PLSSVEAMLGGLPTIVSEWTGTREIVEQIDRKYIIKLDPTILAKKIIEYFQLDLNKKVELSKKYRKAALHFSRLSEIKIKNFKKIIYKNLF
ncbi:MAG: hypothetical protein ACP5H7_03250, partial [Minisyncoccia bacterium]